MVVSASAFRLYCLLAANAASNEAVAERPNVIVVMTDDQGYQNRPYMAIQFYRPPHSLHDESLRLADYHVAPMHTDAWAVAYWD